MRKESNSFIVHAQASQIFSLTILPPLCAKKRRAGKQLGHGGDSTKEEPEFKAVRRDCSS